MTAGRHTHTLADVPHVLREYAVIADGYRGVLIGPHGDVACGPLV